MQRSKTSLDEIVAERARSFADQLREAANWAGSEMDLQIEASKLLQPFEKEAGIKVRAHHNITIGTGRPDSVYGCVIVEYKKPGELGEDPESAGNRAVLKQLRERFVAFKGEEGRALDSMFGVGCDGRWFVFQRYRDGRWDPVKPVAVDRYSAERFLWALYNMGQKGKPFRPDYLAGDFGAQSPLAQAGVKTLYALVRSTRDPRTRDFFRQWQVLFGEVCGFDVTDSTDRLRPLATTYGVSGKVAPAELLFSVHTYYALLMKLLATQVYHHSLRMPSPVQAMISASGERLQHLLQDLEKGGSFRHFKITNFLEGDFFSWYLSVWNEEVEHLVMQMLTRLDDYNPGTMSEEPGEARDLLKGLYQELFPRAVRHHLGEYYTPDWLAELTLDRAGFDGDPDKRFLDPSCGSGTFLVLAIARIRRWYDVNRERCKYTEGELLQKIATNVVGFDLNPLAVMAARTNVLFAIKDLLPHADGIEIPVYLCDSVVTPAAHDQGLFGAKVRKILTVAANFEIPADVTTSRERVSAYAELLQECVERRDPVETFKKRCKAHRLLDGPEESHEKLYGELRRLDAENRNGIWARIIKNAFAPLFVGRFDFVVGNPPWVNWESLPGDYRDAMKPLWKRYGLFTLGGMSAQLGGGKKDLSMLFAYACTDNYLAEGGKLAFVITQTVFKTTGAGDGFRRFSYKVRLDATDERAVDVAVSSVDDMSDFQPFQDATNRTAVFVWQKGSKTEYPVDYSLWIKEPATRIRLDASLREVRQIMDVRKLAARPIQKDTPTSPWMMGNKAALRALLKVIGPSPYRGYEGCNTGGLNGAYWLRILRKLPDGNLLVENLHDVGKKKVKQVQARIEPDFVYPLLRGRDVGAFRASPSAYVLMVQDPKTRAGWKEDEFRERFPLTYDYLLQFREQLLKRAAFRKYFEEGKDAFYTMFNVGEYTLAPSKVAWREQASALTCAVLGVQEGQPMLPDHKLMFIPFETDEEAHYAAALLATSIAACVVKAYAIETSTSTHILQNISIPAFRRTDKAHKRLSELSFEIHSAVRTGDIHRARKLIDDVDTAAAALWGLSDRETDSIRESLTMLGGAPPSLEDDAEDLAEDES
jgi:SAM-dependent methyltransferase